jgi:hypothetical protein
MLYYKLADSGEDKRSYSAPTAGQNEVVARCSKQAVVLHGKHSKFLFRNYQTELDFMMGSCCSENSYSISYP